jgi:D-methionine transport system substrate-binding protein
MKPNFRIKKLVAVIALGITSTMAAAQTDPHAIVFGVAPGPYGDMVKLAIAPTLEKEGYHVSVREFSDYVQPNLALANGGIDANLFQHQLYLGKFATDHALKLSALINVPTAGMGFYSHKIKSLNDLKSGDVITLSNDPTNLAVSGQAESDHTETISGPDQGI